jgi:glutamate-1-semialdehyde 2,1-aminomutase
MSDRYGTSERLLARARRTIPLGAQTFSKSVTQFPIGVSPYFAARAKGSRLWDVDGNEYIDFVNALASVTLGYADPEVNEAVAAQLAKGTIFTLNHELEATVAEQIRAMVPSAEMVRFGKNGSDATAGAIRLARAHTGRDHVLVCGYHGWQDWYIGSTSRDKGVPQSTKSLTHTFSYNDIDSLESKLRALNREVAAIILEPMNVDEPKPGFLEGIRDLATREGIVLIFDEMITGFRFANGGAQERFGIIPDLTTFGKGIANGFPLSAVCGRCELMCQMENIFFSFTMGGEVLSLAAAQATLSRLCREPVIDTMRRRGLKLKEGLSELIARHRVDEFCKVSGDPTWTFFVLSDTMGASAYALKTLWLQEMFARGFLCLGTHNISYAHSNNDINALLAAYDEILPILRDAAENRALMQHLRCAPLEPLFKVR